MNLDQLEKEVKKRKQGMITLENVYVVLLVAAWASIVLLTIILIIGIIIALHLPPNFGRTITDGYNFFTVVASGWNKGVQAISQESPNSQSPSNIELMISELVQLIHGLDVPALLQICPLQNILHSTDVLIDIPSIVQNLKDIISFATTEVTWLPVIGAVMPLQYYFPTYRHSPPTMELKRSAEGYKKQGYWTDSNVVSFTRHGYYFANNTCKLHEKYSLFDNGNQCNLYEIKPYLAAYGYHSITPKIQQSYDSMNHQRINDTFHGDIFLRDALTFGIKLNNEKPSNDLISFNLTFDSIKFYNPTIANGIESITLNKVNGHIPSESSTVFENDLWGLKFNNSVARWQLYKKQYKQYIYDRFRDILPLKLHQKRIQKMAHNKVDNVTINVITVSTNYRTAEWNGKYELYEPGYNEPTSGINMCVLCNQLLSDHQTTIYFKEIIGVLHNSVMHYQLIHEIIDGVLHRWMLKKFKINIKHKQNHTCYEQIASNSLQFTPHILTYNSNWTLQTNSQYEDENARYIESIVIEYVLNSVLWYGAVANENVDKNIYRQYFCLPSVHFKLNTMYLKMKQKISMFEWIPIALQSIQLNALQCEKHVINGNHTVTYLMFDNIKITSDLFGGTTHGKIHFHFKNGYVCNQFIETVKMHHNIGKQVHEDVSINKLIQQTCKLVKNKETNELAKIARDELLPLLSKKRGGSYLVSLFHLKNKTPEQLCALISSPVFSKTVGRLIF
eukprot:168334_1